MWTRSRLGYLEVTRTVLSQCGLYCISADRTRVDFDSLVKTYDLLRAALHIVEHCFSTEFGPIRNGCGAELTLLLDSMGICAANVVVRKEINLHESEVTLLKPWSVPDCCESRTCRSRRDPPTWPSETVVTIIGDAPRHLVRALTAQYGTRRSPSCVRNWQPTSVSLKRKARNSLYTKPLASIVALPYVEAGTIGEAMSQRWNDDITEVTRSVAITGRHIQRCVNTRQKRGSTTVDTHTHTHTHTNTHTHIHKTNQATLLSLVKMRKYTANHIWWGRLR